MLATMEDGLDTGSNRSTITTTNWVASSKPQLRRCANHSCARKVVSESGSEYCPQCVEQLQEMAEDFIHSGDNDLLTINELESI